MLKDISAFTLGKIKVIPDIDNLSCDGKTISIQSTTTQLLCYMALRSNDLITRDELRENVWKNLTTTDQTISQHIYRLRKALKSLDPDGQYIHTVTGRNETGYRIVAEVFAEEQTENNSVTFISRLVNFIHKSLFFSKKPFAIASLLFTCLFLLIFAWLPFSTTPFESPQQITFLEGRERNSAISPDGRLIVYSHKKKSSPFWTIHLQQLEGEQLVVQLTPDPFTTNPISDTEINKLGHQVYDDFPVFTPDGKGISFLRFHQDNKAFYHIDINPDTLTFGKETKLLDIGKLDNIARMVWIDKDNFIYSTYMAKKNTPYKLFKYNIHSRAKTQLTSPPLYRMGDYIFDISPNSQTVAIIRQKVGGYFLYFYDLISAELSEIKKIGKHMRYSITWLDNNSVLYMSDLGYLTRYNISTGESEAYSNQKGIGFYPVKSRNSNVIIMQQEWSYSSLGASIVSVANPRKHQTNTQNKQVTSGSLFTELLPPTKHNRMTTWAGKGRLVYSALNPNKSYKINLLSSNGVSSRLPIKKNIPWPPLISWRPGSDEILVSTDISCFLIDIKLKSSHQFCPDGINPGYTSWSADGKWLYFSLIAQGNWPLMRMAYEGIPLEEVGIDNVSIGKEGPDGQIYYRPNNSIDIYNYNLVTKKSSLVIDRHRIMDGISNNDFQITPEGIYYSDRVNEESNLYFHEFSTQINHFVIGRPSNYDHFSVSDDESTIYFERPGDRESHLMRIQ
ncbi:MAG: winged helix-turn-helix domain-containing protein [Colwellia sp.]|nr:winged helix-turn-helix domain-containing protein [Colwellia sp.]